MGSRRKVITIVLNGVSAPQKIYNVGSITKMVDKVNEFEHSTKWEEMERIKKRLRQDEMVSIDLPLSQRIFLKLNYI